MGSACSEVTDERSAFPSRDLTCFPGAALQTGRDSPMQPLLWGSSCFLSPWKPLCHHCPVQGGTQSHSYVRGVSVGLLQPLDFRA